MNILILLLLLLIFLSIRVKETFTQKCKNKPFLSCLQTPRCGWLAGRGGLHGKCAYGTPVGPLNPLLYPTSESGYRKNIQIDQWIYSEPNPFAR